MEHIDRLRGLGLFDSRVPRYTSYPTAPIFSPETGAAQQTAWLESLNPADPVSVYVHIPFCERLCWFCACHTQGTKTLTPVESYLDTVEAELRMLAARLPSGLRMGRLHWGGGTPTILPPALIHRLAASIRKTFPATETLEFSVEIDPTMVDRAKIDALAAEGVNRASIGVQDFDPLVQKAIGRIQSYEDTRACVDDLRAAGIEALNADLVYGLPHQTEARIADTAEKVLELGPSRLALFGYAHVPWASRRQKLIDEAALPGDAARYRLSNLAAEIFDGAGFRRIGIDHFAQPGDGLEIAAASGRLRRNFQGYTDDFCQTLIGVGASSISRFAQGYVQNAPSAAAYQQRLNAGASPAARGCAFSPDDLLRGRAIEMLMCDFTLNRDELIATFGPAAAALDRDTAAIAQKYQGMVETTPGGGLTILPEGRALTRIIASHYDAYFNASAHRHSHAS